MIKFSVLNNSEKMRTDAFIKKHLIDFSRQTIQDWIESGAILVNDQKVKKKDLLKRCDTVSVFPKHPEPLSLIPQDVVFDLIYEDPSILVLNKPAGLIVHPGAGHPDQTLVNGLLYHVTDFLKEHTDPLRPGIVHRLDKDTSGLILVAKNPESHFKLAEQFANRTVKKRYLAITIGTPKSLLCEESIGRHPSKRQEMTILPNGKPASTTFSLIAQSDRYAFVKAEPKTGRTHQIRVHLQALGSPIFGDPIYGRKMGIEQGCRQLLHAYSLSFSHPITQQPLSFSVKPPEDFQNKLKNLLKIDWNFIEKDLNG